MPRSRKNDANGSPFADLYMLTGGNVRPSRWTGTGTTIKFASQVIAAFDLVVTAAGEAKSSPSPSSPETIKKGVGK